MPRLIDADALKNMRFSCGMRDDDYVVYVPFREVMENIDKAQTVDVLQKLWNALYAEEDKFEKRYISTPEHDNWFLVYRPWLQDGFGIAIKVLSEILMPEPPKEETK